METTTQHDVTPPAPSGAEDNAEMVVQVEGGVKYVVQVNVEESTVLKNLTVRLPKRADSDKREVWVRFHMGHMSKKDMLLFMSKASGGTVDLQRSIKTTFCSDKGDGATDEEQKAFEAWADGHATRENPLPRKVDDQSNVTKTFAEYVSEFFATPEGERGGFIKSLDPEVAKALKAFIVQQASIFMDEESTEEEDN